MASDEPQQELCLQCRKVLFLAQEDDPALGERARLPLESDGDDCFYMCPHCGAKNVVVDERNIYGLPVVKISYIKK